MAEIKKLISGYQEFYRQYFGSGDKLFQELSNGQSPKTLIIACSDSRVDPSIITNANPGDIFVVRNVANLVPPCEDSRLGLHGVSAALEFGVCHLKVEHIVVLGHSQCGGINALITSEEMKNTDFIGRWVAIAESAKEKVLEQYVDPEDQQLHCEQESILLSLNNLLSFPWIKQRVAEGKLKLHGWHFSIGDGNLKQYNPQTSEFESLISND